MILKIMSIQTTLTNECYVFLSLQNNERKTALCHLPHEDSARLEWSLEHLVTALLQSVFPSFKGLLYILFCPKSYGKLCCDYYSQVRTLLKVTATWSRLPEELGLMVVHTDCSFYLSVPLFNKVWLESKLCFK